MSTNMSTKWVVTTATERITLDNTRSSEITFTVTNQAERSSRAVFDIRTGTGVDTSWFTIDDAQRLIRPAASVPYLVRIAVPATVAPGSYEFEARVCPPDAAPEENFVLSRRVLIEVPAPPAPVKKRWPWWLIAILAAVLALVIGVVTWLVWPSGTTPQVQASPTPSATASAGPIQYAAVPKLLGIPLSEAVATLQKAGFTQGSIKYRFEPGIVGTVIRQGLPFDAQAPLGSRLDLEVPIPVTRPTILSPANGSNLPPNTMPLITWSAAHVSVSRWLVIVSPERCTPTAPCGPGPNLSVLVVTTKEYRPPQPAMVYTDVTKQGWLNTGWIYLSVQPLDDIGNRGDQSIIRVYLEH